jgi:hypothetical protein
MAVHKREWRYGGALRICKVFGHGSVLFWSLFATFVIMPQSDCLSVRSQLYNGTYELVSAVTTYRLRCDGKP